MTAFVLVLTTAFVVVVVAVVFAVAAVEAALFVVAAVAEQPARVNAAVIAAIVRPFLMNDCFI